MWWGRQSRGAALVAWAAYADAAEASGRASFAAAAVYAGIELLRRTLGAARVAAVERDDAGLAVVDAGLRLVQNPPASPREL